MSTLALLIIFLLNMSMCPVYYWSTITETIYENAMNNSNVTTTTPSAFSAILRDQSFNLPFTTSPQSKFSPPFFFFFFFELRIKQKKKNLFCFVLFFFKKKKKKSETMKSENYQEITMHLNLWHIKYCTANYTNTSYSIPGDQFNNNDDTLTGDVIIHNNVNRTFHSCNFQSFQHKCY
ncbi:hypothetical protein RFI_23235, partial [Reticulomyxa filosa]